MRCPFRFKEFSTEEGHQTCVDDCALLMTDIEDGVKACAFSVIALNTGTQNSDNDKNTFVIENEVMPDAE